MIRICNTLLVFLMCFFTLTSFANEISKINISGNKRVETSTIKEYLGIKVGDDYSPEIKNKGIKSLYATSLFEDIEIVYNEGILNVSVKENLFISEVKFSGNSKVKTDILENSIITSAGESFKHYKIQSDVRKIKEIYQKAGRFAAVVNSKVEHLDNNRVKVIFDISEGPKTVIKNIYFVGNKHYTASELKSIIMTKESKWFRFLSSNDSYDPSRLEYDKYLLKQFYGSVGFADFRVISVTSELMQTKEGFILTYSIDEGKKHNLGDVTLNNELLEVSDREILDLIKHKKGDVFNIEKIESTIDEISKYLSNRGFPSADVRTENTINSGSQSVDVEFKITKTSKQYINRINISGNIKTEDQVIRRELRIEEGDIFNRSLVERGARNIRNLNYFDDDISVTWDQSEYADRYDLNIDVQEKSTANIGLELGYDTSSGIFGKLSFVERNLVGTGRILDMGVRTGKKNTHYYAGITDPYFMGSDFALGVNAFHSNNSSVDNNGLSKSQGSRSDRKSYSSKSTGVGVLVGYNITDDLNHQIEYEIKRDKLTASGKNKSIFIQEQIGSRLSSSVSHTLTYDLTDNRHLPKSGYIISGMQQYTGLGGDNKFIKHEVNGKIYKSFLDNKYTLSFTSFAGHMKGISGKKVVISDRFNVGGYNLRGFASRGIGPRIKKGSVSIEDDEESLGGQKYYTLSTELSTALPFIPKEFDVIGSIFLDAGALWDADSKVDSGFHNSKSLRSSVGFGFLWITRMAPIKMDWGFPIKRKKYDETQRFSLRFSTEL